MKVAVIQHVSYIPKSIPLFREKVIADVYEAVPDPTRVFSQGKRVNAESIEELQCSSVLYFDRYSTDAQMQAAVTAAFRGELPGAWKAGGCRENYGMIPLE